MTAPQPTLEQLAERIAKRDFEVAVIGLGYVGLPLASAFLNRGFRVLGVDVDPHKVLMLNRGESYLRRVASTALERAIAERRFAATSDFDRLWSADAMLICVPTPLDQHQQPDLGFVERTALAVRERLRPGHLVVLESTTYPGTTDELVRGILEQKGLRAGRDFYLAYSPEREDPGNAAFAISDIPKLVGGVDEASGELAEKLYAAAIARVIRVANARIAEAAKLTENVFRAVNIALVNELKVVFDCMGLDIWAVLDAAETKPFGFMRFNPGPGWGGHCIPVDPFYLSWKARAHGPRPRFIELAGELNTHMHEYVIGKLVEGLNRQGTPVKGSQVLMLGLAYKKDVNDCRESPAFPIMAQLIELGASVGYHDRFVPEIPALREWPSLQGRQSVELTRAELRAADVVLIVTDHSLVDYELVRREARLVVDSRGVLRSGNNLIQA